MQPPTRTYRLTVQSSLFDPDIPGCDEVHFREGVQDMPLYRVFLSLAGGDLPYVEKVIYVLHPTFPQRTLEVYRRPANANCKAVIWTWGTFEVVARVELKNGGSTEITHPLEWDKELKRPGIRFIRDSQA
jgi:transcription initiation factor IIF auxiliary subunit